LLAVPSAGKSGLGRGKITDCGEWAGYGIAVVALVIALASAAYTRLQAVASKKAAAIEDQRRYD